MSETDQPENRLGLEDVSEQVSMIFFGNGVGSDRPIYSYSYQPSPGNGSIWSGRSLYRGKYYNVDVVEKVYI